MAKTNFDQYVEKRQKAGTRESRAARRVFEEAYSVATVLMTARKERGLTQAELASLSGVQQADISRMERGSMIPNMSTFLKLMESLNVSVNLKMEKSARSKSSGKLLISSAG